MFYRRASGAGPGLVDLQLAAEEQEEVAGQCAAEAGGKKFPFNLVLRKLGVIIDRLYMKCMKSEGCLCYDYQQVHMTYL